MDDETDLTQFEETVPDKRAQFWRRIGANSTRLLLFGVSVVVFRLLHVSLLGGKTEPGPIARCFGIAALASFIIGAFLAAVWVLHALAVGGKSEPSHDGTRKLNPIASLLLTGRLGSTATENMAKDILFGKALLALFATVVSVFLLVLLWTHK